MIIGGKRMVLVGAEGASEMQGAPWCRTADEVETATFIRSQWTDEPVDGRPMTAEEKYHDTCVDGNNRPYWLVVISDDAPDDVKARAERFLRRVRLTE
jgi:hypothetical protein